MCKKTENPSKPTMTAFNFAQTAINKVLNGKTFQWERLKINITNFPPHHDVEEEKLFDFVGSIKVSEEQFSAMSTVRIAKDSDGKWKLVNVDVHCHPPGRIEIVDSQIVCPPTEEIEPYTLFEIKSGDLVKVA